MFFGACALALGTAAASAAQPPATTEVEVDPVECWWKTSTPSVRVGEPFTVHLTCAALETEAASAIVDRATLGTASVQLPPFEVTGGTQSADYVSDSRRYFQYHYIVRLIAEDYFGSDVIIPSLPITYRIESRIQADSALVGREQTYELPPLPMRVESLVAADAGHIREPAVPSLDDIAAREFRARLFRIAATILFGLAALTLVLALVRGLRRGRTAESATAAHLRPHRGVLAGVRQELLGLQQQTRQTGWDQEAVARALAAARITATYLAGRTPTQRETARATSGELLLASGLFRGRAVAVSGSATARDLADHPGASDLDGALAAFSAARYGRVETTDTAVLDEALAAALAATRRAAAAHTRVADAMRSMTQTMRGWAPRAWAR